MMTGSQTDKAPSEAASASASASPRSTLRSPLLEESESGPPGGRGGGNNRNSAAEVSVERPGNDGSSSSGVVPNAHEEAAPPPQQLPDTTRSSPRCLPQRRSWSLFSYNEDVSQGGRASSSAGSTTSGRGVGATTGVPRGFRNAGAPTPQQEESDYSPPPEPPPRRGRRPSLASLAPLEVLRSEAAQTAEALRSECEAGLRRVRYLMTYLACLSVVVMPAVGVCEWIAVESRRGNLERDWWKCMVHDNLEIQLINSHQEETLPGVFAIMLYQSTLLAWAAVIFYQRSCIRMDWISSCIVNNLFTLMLIAFPPLQCTFPAPSAITASLASMFDFVRRASLFSQVPEPNKCGKAVVFSRLCVGLVFCCFLANLLSLLFVCRAEGIRRRAVTAEKRFFRALLDDEDRRAGIDDNDDTPLDDDDDDARDDDDDDRVVDDDERAPYASYHPPSNLSSSSESKAAERRSLLHHHHKGGETTQRPSLPPLREEDLSSKGEAAAGLSGFSGLSERRARAALQKAREDDDDAAKREARGGGEPRGAADKKTRREARNHHHNKGDDDLRRSLREETEGLTHRLCCHDAAPRAIVLPRSIVLGAIMTLAYVVSAVCRTVLIVVTQRAYDTFTEAYEIDPLDKDSLQEQVEAARQALSFFSDYKAPNRHHIPDGQDDWDFPGLLDDVLAGDDVTIFGGQTLIAALPSLAIGPSAAFLAFASILRGFSGDDLANYRLAALLALAALFVDAPAFAATVHVTIQRDLYDFDVDKCANGYILEQAKDIFGFPSHDQARTMCRALFVNFYATCVHVLAVSLMAVAAIRTFTLNHKSFDDVVMPAPGSSVGAVHLLQTDDPAGFEYDLNHAPRPGVYSLTDLYDNASVAGSGGNDNVAPHNLALDSRDVSVADESKAAPFSMSETTAPLAAGDGPRDGRVPLVRRRSDSTLAGAASSTSQAFPTTRYSAIIIRPRASSFGTSSHYHHAQSPPTHGSGPGGGPGVLPDSMPPPELNNRGSTSAWNSNRRATVFARRPSTSMPTSPAHGAAAPQGTTQPGDVSAAAAASLQRYTSDP